VQPTQLEVRNGLEKLKCGNCTVQQYAVEFEEVWVLQKPAERMSEGEKIHLFFKGLPEHLQIMHMTDWAGELWRSYDHVKRVVGTTDKHFCAYAKTTTLPQQSSMPSSSPAGPNGRQQATPWKGGKHKRPFQQGQQADHKAKKVNEGGPSNIQSRFKCSKPGHKGYECRHRKSVKYYGKPKTDNKRHDDNGPSGGQRDFAKPNYGFVLVYMDDILVYSLTEDEHTEHLKWVLEKSRKHKYYMHLWKCNFYKRELEYLGHVVGHNGLKVDPKKLVAVQEWLVPRDVGQPSRAALSSRPALHCPTASATTSPTAAIAATEATLATAHTAAMASPTVLTFDAEGRAVDFDVWVDDLQLFIQCDSRDGVSLFDHTSGVSTAPAATADSAVRSQWTTHDAVARLAVRSHPPP
ncbi:unnamed protein product, partial [Closterium sp. NIES-54]